MTRFAAAVVAIVSVAPIAMARADGFKDLDLMRSPPKPAPDFTVASLAAEPLRLRDYRGRVVLLNFWATWCRPCKKEMPSIERLYRRYPGRGFAVLAVSIDAGGRQRVAAFVKELALTFPIGLDPSETVANDYGVRVLPSTFLLDRSGAVVAIGLGPRNWDGAAAHAVVESLLEKPQ